jgi:hypothetical protein
MKTVFTRGAALIMIAVLFFFGCVTTFAAESPEPTPDILDTLHNGAPPAMPTVPATTPGAGEPLPQATPAAPPTFGEPEPSPEPVSPLSPLYPADVRGTEENGARWVIKTYELSEGESPNGISRESFELDGWRYELTDILKKEIVAVDTREHTESVTVSSATKEISEILPLLAPTLDFTAEDGCSGTLKLDIATIKADRAGTRISSFTKTVMREYPHLSNNDISLIPKTVEDGGRTYTLADVDWRAGNSENIDYTDLPQYRTAVATYSRTGMSTIVTGYTITAEYKGTIAKSVPGKTVYAAYFAGTLLAPSEPARERGAIPLRVAAGAAAGTGLLGGAVFFFFLRRNVRVHNLKDGKYVPIGKTRVTAKNPVINLTPFAAGATTGSFILALDRFAARSMSGKTVTVNYGAGSLQHIIENGGGEYRFEMDF